MSDAKYFSSSKKGDQELNELRDNLASTDKKVQCDAVKKVIASMTVGKDVSSLFAEIAKSSQSDNLELKKLTYLYIMNYAKSRPDLAISAVNSFVKGCEDPNPLIRALAVRTMGCIRVETITEYLSEPLRKTLKDDDPYVRKTAAVCVAKLYDINRDMVREQGFIDSLKELLSDSNPMVVANAVAALSEIHDSSPGAGVFDMQTSTVSKLLTALNECTEWGQIFILDSLAIYNPKDEREMKSICERVGPRLQHVNAAVVLSAIKVIMKLMEGMSDREFVALLVKKLAPPLVTLMSSQSEVQYVALRNINLIVQKTPDALTNHMKVFFVKYNDPIYVKLEKLDVMIRLTSSANIQPVLAELREYAQEVDVDFVRKAVRAIGRCAIKVSDSAQRCVDLLVDLINNKVNYVVQEAIVVIKDIFRKYPNQYESIIAVLCENLDILDEPEAKASMIWIVGEYADRIDNADELLDSFLENFVEETSPVQLALLTGIVKLFLKRPQYQALVQKVLTLATQESDNPDLRDRGFIYWRLLLTDPAAAKAVVLTEKPLISEETDLLEPSLLNELITHISSLASVYHKPPSTFVDADAARTTSSDEVTLMGDGQEDLLGGPVGQLVGLDIGGGASGAPPPPGPLVKPKELWLDSSQQSAENPGSIDIHGTVARRNGNTMLEMTVTNKAAVPVGDFAWMFKPNSFALQAQMDPSFQGVPAGSSAECKVACNPIGSRDRTNPLNKLDVAMKNAVGVYYFTVFVPWHTLLAEDGKLDPPTFGGKWGTISDPDSSIQQINGISGGKAAINQRCADNNIFFVTEQNVGGKDEVYYSMKLINNIELFAKITIAGDAVQVQLKTAVKEVYAAFHSMFQEILGGSAPPPSLF
jgi:AP-1 complex subunit beta-1